MDDRQRLAPTPPLPQKGLDSSLWQHGRNLVHFLAFTKTAYFTYMLVLPMWLSGLHWFQVLAGWVVMQLVAGFLLAVIFQPAHVMEHHDYTPQ